METKFEEYKGVLNSTYKNDVRKKKSMMKIFLNGVNQDIKNKIKSSSIFLLFSPRAPQILQTQFDSLFVAGENSNPLSNYIDNLSTRKQIKGKITRQQIQRIVQQNLDKSIKDANLNLNQCNKRTQKLKKGGLGERTKTAQQIIDEFNLSKTLSKAPQVPTHQPGTRSKPRTMSLRQLQQRINKLKST